MAYVDIDLDDISTNDLIDELENRYLDDREKLFLLDIVKQDEGCLKLKFLFQVYDKYSFKELQEMFKEDYSTPISENQLALELK